MYRNGQYIVSFSGTSTKTVGKLSTKRRDAIYYYQIRAMDRAGNKSGYSNKQSVRIP